MLNVVGGDERAALAAGGRLIGCVHFNDFLDGANLQRDVHRACVSGGQDDVLDVDALEGVARYIERVGVRLEAGEVVGAFRVGDGGAPVASFAGDELQR